MWALTWVSHELFNMQIRWESQLKKFNCDSHLKISHLRQETFFQVWFSHMWKFHMWYCLQKMKNQNQLHRSLHSNQLKIFIQLPFLHLRWISLAPSYNLPIAQWLSQSRHVLSARTLPSHPFVTILHLVILPFHLTQSLGKFRNLCT